MSKVQAGLCNGARLEVSSMRCGESCSRGRDEEAGGGEEEADAARERRLQETGPEGRGSDSPRHYEEVIVASENVSEEGIRLLAVQFFFVSVCSEPTASGIA